MTTKYAGRLTRFAGSGLNDLAVCTVILDLVIVCTFVKSSPVDPTTATYAVLIDIGNAIS